MHSGSSPTEVGPKGRPGWSREAIIEAARRLFLQRGFGFVSMDDLGKTAGVARRMLSTCVKIMYLRQVHLL
ncbi:helix-turn-helix domain-containing protein [Rhizobium grahamii]|uniref:HTH tetR-type domain-containing protein n=1 Tax=Rhizobium grahamii CCGE 502 TaxID=990285 RepID=S3HCL8_9HYPH|nr:helix-turn-helix domain-containing protein [Rhizobium grahamii]EPE96399.1 hypothetical protein RGCCGE502_21065 [Rhizobium grahamii CCGE 502]